MKTRLAVLILALCWHSVCAAAIFNTGGGTASPPVAPTVCTNNMNFGQACSLGFLGALF